MRKRIEFALHRTYPDETVFCRGLCLSSLDRYAGAVKREAFTVVLSDQLRMSDRGTLNASEYEDGKDKVGETHAKVSIVLASSCSVANINWTKWNVKHGCYRPTL